MLKIDKVVAELAEKHDQLVIAAALAKLPKEDLEKIQLPWKRLCRKIDEQKATQDRRTKILEVVQEALSQLRLDMKYLLFDLEATRRERDELQRQLDARD